MPDDSKTDAKAVATKSDADAKASASAATIADIKAGVPDEVKPPVADRQVPGSKETKEQIATTQAADPVNRGATNIPMADPHDPVDVKAAAAVDNIGPFNPPPAPIAPQAPVVRPDVGVHPQHFHRELGVNPLPVGKADQDESQLEIKLGEMRAFLQTMDHIPANEHLAMVVLFLREHL